jgi:hypothetical protein
MLMDDTLCVCVLMSMDTTVCPLTLQLPSHPMVQAECARDKDKSHLLSELRRKCGMQRSNTIVTEVLGCTLFSKLRWRSSMWGWAMYALLNLRGSDHLPLQQLIASILDLSDEQEEMRLLNSYGENGGGWGRLAIARAP